MKQILSAEEYAKLEATSRFVLRRCYKSTNESLTRDLVLEWISKAEVKAEDSEKRKDRHHERDKERLPKRQKART